MPQVSTGMESEQNLSSPFPNAQNIFITNSTFVNTGNNQRERGYGHNAPPGGGGGYGGAPNGGYGRAPPGGFGGQPLDPPPHGRGGRERGYGPYGHNAPPGGGGGYGGAPPGGYGRAPPGGFGGQPLDPPPHGRGGPYGGGGGGFIAPHGDHAMPLGADPQLWNWFTTVDLDRSGSINSFELELALTNGDWIPFDLDTVKLLMTIFGTDRNGTIDFTEFAGILKYIKDWQNVFRRFDRDRSGSIDGGELRDALGQLGFNLSPPLVDLVIKKYVTPFGVLATTTPGGRGAPPPEILFDRFVRVCVVVKQLSESFKGLDTNRSGWIQFNHDQFMQTVLSLLNP